MILSKKPKPQKPIGEIQSHTLLTGISPAMRWSLLACLLIAFAFSIPNIILFFRPFGFISILIAQLTLFIIGLLAAALLTLILAGLKKLHWLTSMVVFVSVFLCFTTMFMALYITPLLIFGMAAVYLAVMIFTGQYKSLRKPKKILYYSLLVLSGALSVTLLLLTFWPGPVLKEDARPDTAALALPYAGQINNTAPALDDPSAPGNYQYEIYHYASLSPNSTTGYHYPVPSDQPHETLSTQTVDASELLEGWSFLRRQMLGFEADRLPLNAQVWMPVGEGPFPLALIVHGNHESGDRSDGGYAYLGELLASHGIIAASVDENFLNSSVLYDLLFFNTLKKENSTRAFVLLEHLRQWYEWNANSTSPFFEKVDFDNLALIGHSRGGDAVSIAAAFSRLGYYPDNGMVSFDYPFQIKTVVAIAPTYRQYDPAGLELSLKNVNYLVLHGGNDMDVQSFQGANMYRRTDVSENGIKAQVWMQYANHGQFNSSWKVHDAPGLMQLMYNEKLLMPMTEQQQAAKVLIGAFLESTLLGRDEYNTLFKDFTYGAEWLPAAEYVTDYADSQTVLLDNYDSSYDLSTSSSGLVTYSAQGFDKWTIDLLPAKWENSNRVLTLTWGSEEYTEKYGEQLPVFKVEFEPDTFSVGSKLYLSVCSGKQDSQAEEISFDIRLTDSSGNTFTMNINDFGGVADPIDSPISKPLFASIIGSSEPILQAVCIPTEQFKGLHGEIVSMEWIIHNTTISKKGQILYADDLRLEK